MGGEAEVERRERPPVAVVVAGGVLLAGQGALATGAGLGAQEYAVIQTLRAATPRDYAVLVRRAAFPTVAGLVLSTIGTAIVLGWLLSRVLRGGRASPPNR